MEPSSSQLSDYCFGIGPFRPLCSPGLHLRGVADWHLQNQLGGQRKDFGVFIRRLQQQREDIEAPVRRGPAMLNTVLVAGDTGKLVGGGWVRPPHTPGPVHEAADSRAAPPLVYP